MVKQSNKSVVVVVVHLHSDPDWEYKVLPSLVNWNLCPKIIFLLHIFLSQYSVQTYLVFIKP